MDNFCIPDRIFKLNKNGRLLKGKETTDYGNFYRFFICTVLMERESLLTILTERERFLFNSNGGGTPSPSIWPLRLWAWDPNTLRSSHMST